MAKGAGLGHKFSNMPNDQPPCTPTVGGSLCPREIANKEADNLGKIWNENKQGDKRPYEDCLCEIKSLALKSNKKLHQWRGVFAPAKLIQLAGEFSQFTGSGSDGLAIHLIDELPLVVVEPLAEAFARWMTCLTLPKGDSFTFLSLLGKNKV